MPEAKPGFAVVGEEAVPTQRTQQAAMNALMLGIKALSQRAYIALLDTFSLITAGLVFWLYLSIPDPNTHQLVAEGMFAVFILSANTIVRRK